MHFWSPLSKWILMKNKTEIKLRMLLQNCSEVLSGFHYIFLSSFPSDEKQVHTYYLVLTLVCLITMRVRNMFLTYFP